MLSHATVSPDYLQVNQVEDLGLMPNLSEDITQLWFWGSAPVLSSVGAGFTLFICGRGPLTPVESC